ncbi:MAG: DUF2922 domain-containing protein [Alkaliphilus sp.]|nr:DUF2922 domain-containing protein [Alkaliphilus sp.]
MGIRRLEMVFNNELGRTSKITLDDVRDEVTQLDVQTAMENIINKNIFDTSGGELVGIESARIVTTAIEEMLE